MKNFVQPGKSIDVAAPAGGVISGNIAVIGSLIGVAAATVAQGEQVALSTEGVFEMAKVSALAIATGDKVYWDAAAKNVNKTSAGNTLVGIAVADAANPSATVKIKLGATTV
jgi:predicted RecA/RadA family phage recombinase